MKILKGEEISQNELLELVYLKFGGGRSIVFQYSQQEEKEGEEKAG